MADEIVVTAQRFGGTEGRAARIEVHTPDGPKILVLTEEKLGGLFTIVCTAISALAAERTGTPKTLVLEPQGWRLGPLGGGRLGVTFLLDGMELTFAVPTSQIEAAEEALRQISHLLRIPPLESRH